MQARAMVHVYINDKFLQDFDVFIEENQLKYVKYNV